MNLVASIGKTAPALTEFTDSKQLTVPMLGGMRRRCQLILLSALICLAVSSQAWADDSTLVRTGKISGRVIDAVTKVPVVGASVVIVGQPFGSATDDNGGFTLVAVPVGSYSLRCSAVAYDAVVKTDIIVRPKRVTFVEAALPPRTVEVDSIQVTSSYFTSDRAQPTSSTGFNGEEVRRAPGSAGDVSRIIALLPSIAKTNDQMNSLVVRGGTPTECGFYIDNIEIPNINHFPLPGSSGGPISLVNVDFVRNVSFSAGGFGASYGDRLSAIMDLEFREGNREEFDSQLDLNFAGFGLVGEGPISWGAGSWMLSVRRSYLDLLVDAIGTGVAPRYSDYQGKVVYDLGRSHRLSLLAIVGKDFINFDSAQSADDGNIVYGTYKGYELSTGVNWRYLWPGNGYSNTSLSVLSTDFDGEFWETNTGGWLTEEATRETAVQLRNVNVVMLSERHPLEFGLESKYYFNNYDIYVTEYTDPLGGIQPELNMDLPVQSPRFGGFASLTVTLSDRLTVTGGLRYDYLRYNRHGHVSPRFAFDFRLGPRTNLTGATGTYNQHLPLILLAQWPQNKRLSDPQADHFILGLHQLLAENTRMTVETYYKGYTGFPVDTLQPQLFVVDELTYRGFFGNYPSLVDDGRARSYGVEVTVQKKLVAGTYGLASIGWARAEYRGLDGLWRSRVYDNRFVASVEGGYRLNNRWEFSTRWIYAGGPPYTPLDLDLSRLWNRSVLDSDRVNRERMPAYHSLNLRVDRTFSFNKSNLVVYFSVWNAYNRRNVAQYYWNGAKQRQDILYQWSLLPVFGLEYEF
ncbi:MAG: TonB-dependent receptor [Candidatus Zixiibacteriota bacterium]